jgi:hypothetical protein
MRRYLDTLKKQTYVLGPAGGDRSDAAAPGAGPLIERPS